MQVTRHIIEPDKTRIDFLSTAQKSVDIICPHKPKNCRLNPLGMGRITKLFKGRGVKFRFFLGVKDKAKFGQYEEELRKLCPSGMELFLYEDDGKSGEMEVSYIIDGIWKLKTVSETPDEKLERLGKDANIDTSDLSKEDKERLDYLTGTIEVLEVCRDKEELMHVQNVINSLFEKAYKHFTCLGEPEPVKTE